MGLVIYKKQFIDDCKNCDSIIEFVSYSVSNSNILFSEGFDSDTYKVKVIVSGDSFRINIDNVKVEKCTAIYIFYKLSGHSDIKPAFVISDKYENGELKGELVLNSNNNIFNVKINKDINRNCSFICNNLGQDIEYLENNCNDNGKNIFSAIKEDPSNLKDTDTVSKYTFNQYIVEQNSKSHHKSSFESIDFNGQFKREAFLYKVYKNITCEINGVDNSLNVLVKTGLNSNIAKGEFETVDINGTVEFDVFEVIEGKLSEKPVYSGIDSVKNVPELLIEHVEGSGNFNYRIENYSKVIEYSNPTVSTITPYGIFKLTIEQKDFYSNESYKIESKRIKLIQKEYDGNWYIPSNHYENKIPLILNDNYGGSSGASFLFFLHTDLVWEYDVNRDGISEDELDNFILDLKENVKFEYENEDLFKTFLEVNISSDSLDWRDVLVDGYCRIPFRYKFIQGQNTSTTNWVPWVEDNKGNKISTLTKLIIKYKDYSAPVYIIQKALQEQEISSLKLFYEDGSEVTNNKISFKNNEKEKNLYFSTAETSNNESESTYCYWKVLYNNNPSVSFLPSNYGKILIGNEDKSNCLFSLKCDYKGWEDFNSSEIQIVRSKDEDKGVSENRSATWREEALNLNNSLYKFSVHKDRATPEIEIVGSKEVSINKLGLLTFKVKSNTPFYVDMCAGLNDFDNNGIEDSDDAYFRNSVGGNFDHIYNLFFIDQEESYGREIVDNNEKVVQKHPSVDRVSCFSRWKGEGCYYSMNPVVIKESESVNHFFSGDFDSDSVRKDSTYNNRFLVNDFNNEEGVEVTILRKELGYGRRQRKVTNTNTLDPYQYIYPSKIYVYSKNDHTTFDCIKYIIKDGFELNAPHNDEYNQEEYINEDSKIIKKITCKYLYKGELVYTLTDDNLKEIWNNNKKSIDKYLFFPNKDFEAIIEVEATGLCRRPGIFDLTNKVDFKFTKLAPNFNSDGELLHYEVRIKPADNITKDTVTSSFIIANSLYVDNKSQIDVEYNYIKFHLLYSTKGITSISVDGSSFSGVQGNEINVSTSITNNGLLKEFKADPKGISGYPVTSKIIVSDKSEGKLSNLLLEQASITPIGGDTKVPTPYYYCKYENKEFTGNINTIADSYIFSISDQKGSNESNKQEYYGRVILELFGNDIENPDIYTTDYGYENSRLNSDCKKYKAWKKNVPNSLFGINYGIFLDTMKKLAIDCIGNSYYLVKDNLDSVDSKKAFSFGEETELKVNFTYYNVENSLNISPSVVDIDGGKIKFTASWKETEGISGLAKLESNITDYENYENNGERRECTIKNNEITVPSRLYHTQEIANKKYKFLLFGEGKDVDYKNYIGDIDFLFNYTQKKGDYIVRKDSVNLKQLGYSNCLILKDINSPQDYYAYFNDDFHKMKCSAKGEDTSISLFGGVLELEKGKEIEKGKEVGIFKVDDRTSGDVIVSSNASSNWDEDNVTIHFPANRSNKEITRSILLGDVDDIHKVSIELTQGPADDKFTSELSEPLYLLSNGRLFVEDDISTFKFTTAIPKSDLMLTCKIGEEEIELELPAPEELADGTYKYDLELQLPPNLTNKEREVDITFYKIYSKLGERYTVKKFTGYQGYYSLSVYDANDLVNKHLYNDLSNVVTLNENGVEISSPFSDRHKFKLELSRREYYFDKSNNKYKLQSNPTVYKSWSDYLDDDFDLIKLYSSVANNNIIESTLLINELDDIEMGNSDHVNFLPYLYCTYSKFDKGIGTDIDVNVEILARFKMMPELSENITNYLNSRSIKFGLILKFKAR
jgi:hypothetical protein